MSSSSPRRLPSRRFLVFTLFLCVVAPLVAWWRRPAPPRVEAKPYRFPLRELEALDRAVQVRFAVVPDSDFGLPRVGKRHSYFYPAIPSEKVAVKNLQAAGQDVVFYVVGRNVLLKQINAMSYASVQGPVYITPQTALKVKPRIQYSAQARFASEGVIAKDAPSDLELTKLSRRVFEDDALRNGTDAKIGNWHVVARPVAANSQQCVDCHNRFAPWKGPDRMPRISFSLKSRHDIIALGDTVGIALYCYRPTRKVETKILTDDELLAKPGQ